MRFPLIKRNGHKPVTGDIVKAQVLKNKEGLLDVLSEGIEKGNRACPLLMGHPCLAKACMMFMEFKFIDKEGNETKFYNCSFVQTPLLLIENARNIRQLQEAINVKMANSDIK